MKQERSLSVYSTNSENDNGDTTEGLLMTFVKHTFSFVGGIIVTLLAMVAAIAVKLLFTAMR